MITMKNINIYLSRKSYTEDHNDKMAGLLAVMEKAGEVANVKEGENPDMASLVYEMEATPWAVDFLRHMSDCDMLWFPED